MSAAAAETQAEEESRDLQAAQSSVSSDGRHITAVDPFNSSILLLQRRFDAVMNTNGEGKTKERRKKATMMRRRAVMVRQFTTKSVKIEPGPLGATRSTCMQTISVGCRGDVFCECTQDKIAGR